MRGPADLAHFDVIATNPPFGGSLPISDRETLSQFELGYFWKPTDDGGWKRTDNLQTSQPPEILFIERCWQFLKPGGRAWQLFCPTGFSAIQRWNTCAIG
ncbi:MAG: hypothetical protein ACXWT4_13250 [Methylobacter sp.]